MSWVFDKRFGYDLNQENCEMSLMESSPINQNIFTSDNIKYLYSIFQKQSQPLRNIAGETTDLNLKISSYESKYHWVPKIPSHFKQEKKHVKRWNEIRKIICHWIFGFLLWYGSIIHRAATGRKSLCKIFLDHLVRRFSRPEPLHLQNVVTL